MANNVDCGLDKSGIFAGAQPVGKVGDKPITAQELYKILSSEEFLLVEQGSVLGYLTGRPVMIFSKGINFTRLIVDFYRRFLQEIFNEHAR